MIHDFRMIVGFGLDARDEAEIQLRLAPGRRRDRKSTRLNSSHRVISYAVFCLKQNNGSFAVFEIAGVYKALLTLERKFSSVGNVVGFFFLMIRRPPRPPPFPYRSLFE